MERLEDKLNPDIHFYPTKDQTLAVFLSSISTYKINDIITYEHILKIVNEKYSVAIVGANKKIFVKPLELLDHKKFEDPIGDAFGEVIYSEGNHNKSKGNLFGINSLKAAINSNYTIYIDDALENEDRNKTIKPA